MSLLLLIAFTLISTIAAQSLLLPLEWMGGVSIPTWFSLLVFLLLFSWCMGE